MRQEDLYIPANINIPLRVRIGYFVLRFLGSAIVLAIGIGGLVVAQAIYQGGLN